MLLNEYRLEIQFKKVWKVRNINNIPMVGSRPLEHWNVGLRRADFTWSLSWFKFWWDLRFSVDCYATLVLIILSHYIFTTTVITFLTVFILTHPVNFPCGRKPERPEKTHDFRESADWLFTWVRSENRRTHDLRGERCLLWRLRHRIPRFDRALACYQVLSSFDWSLTIHIYFEKVTEHHDIIGTKLNELLLVVL
jgi:hypothetical protein